MNSTCTHLSSKYIYLFVRSHYRSSLFAVGIHICTFNCAIPHLDWVRPASISLLFRGTLSFRSVSHSLWHYQHQHRSQLHFLYLLLYTATLDIHTSLYYPPPRFRWFPFTPDAHFLRLSHQSVYLSVYHSLHFPIMSHHSVPFQLFFTILLICVLSSLSTLEAFLKPKPPL